MDNPAIEKRAAFSKRLHLYYEYRYIYLLLLPGFIYFLVFRIAPMWGLSIAFIDFTPYSRFWDSQWLGLKISSISLMRRASTRCCATQWP